MGIAQMLRTMRERAGFSQSELARRTGLPRTVINAYEHGSREPRSEVVSLIADACGQTIVVQDKPRIDLERNGRILMQVLDLADALPFRPSPELKFPPLATS